MVDQVKPMEDYRPCVNDRILLDSFGTVEETQAFLDLKYGYNDVEVLQITLCRNNPEDGCEQEPWRVTYNTVAFRKCKGEWRFL